MTEPAYQMGDVSALASPCFEMLSFMPQTVLLRLDVSPASEKYIRKSGSKDGVVLGEAGFA